MAHGGHRGQAGAAFLHHQRELSRNRVAGPYQPQVAGWLAAARSLRSAANAVGATIESKVSDLYVLGEEIDLPSTAERYLTGIGTAPTDNLVTEFLPDVARHIRFRAVLFQWIINQAGGINGTARP